MADTKISVATAVVTPAPTDEYATAQAGASKRTTRAQMHALQSGEHLVIPIVDEVATPTLAISTTGATGFYSPSEGIVVFAVGGVEIFRVDSTGIAFNDNTFSPKVMNNNPSDAAPCFTVDGDQNSGMGQTSADGWNVTVGAILAQQWNELSNAVIYMQQADVGLTADIGSIQGGGVLLSSFNVFSTVANAGDAATLPSSAVNTKVGSMVTVKNDGANSMDVFPALGHDAGAGANVAVAIAAGSGKTFMATVDSSTWTVINSF